MQLVLLTPRGERLVCSRTQRPEVFAAAQVSLGALGVLSEVTLRVRPRHVLRRRVWLMTTEELLQAAPALAARHRQFECFLLPHTGYGAAITHDEVNTPPMPHEAAPDEDVLRDLRHLRDWLGRWPALRRWVAQRFIDPAMHEETTDWSWKLDPAAPVQRNECHVPRDQGIACLREVLAALGRRNDTYFDRFRYVAASSTWLCLPRPRQLLGRRARRTTSLGLPHQGHRRDPPPPGAPTGASCTTTSTAELSAVPRWRDQVCAARWTPTTAC
jgi:hypothetical protein